MPGIHRLYGQFQGLHQFHQGEAACFPDLCTAQTAAVIPPGAPKAGDGMTEAMPSL